MEDLEESQQTSAPFVERRVNDSRIAYLERRMERFEEKIDGVADKVGAITNILTQIRNTALAIGFILSPTTFAQLASFMGGGVLPQPQYQQPAQSPTSNYPRGSDDSQLPPRP
jgi:uroporphyrinogen-III decarboxylase